MCVIGGDCLEQFPLRNRVPTGPLLEPCAVFLSAILPACRDKDFKVTQTITLGAGKLKAYEIRWPSNDDCNRIAPAKVRRTSGGRRTGD